MVELTTGTAVALGAAVAGVLLVLVLLLIVARRRRAGGTRRLSMVAARLDIPGARAGDERDSLTRLERLAQSTVLRVTDAEAAATRLSGALAVLEQGVVVVDDAGSVVYRNQVADAVIGAERGQGLATEALDDVLDAAIKGERRSRTLELLGPPRRSISVSGHPLDDGKRAVGAVAVLDDVTERRRLDTIRRDFLTNVTTELKTPVGALGLLAGTIVAEDDAGLTRRLAERLRQDALRVGRLVDDMTELSRLDSGAPGVREPIAVHLVVAQAVEAGRSLALHRRITIDTAEAPNRLTVVGDRRQLVSAVRHLVENAVRYSEDGSAVGVEVAVRGQWVEISVSDEGVGVPARELDRIFECFYRVANGRAHDPGGSGLGLAIASQVAGGHGGQLVVDSTEGTGSVFTLRLPAGPGATAVPAAEAG